MTNLKQIIDSIINGPDFSYENLYLLESVNETCGFLLGDNKVYFAIGSGGTQNESIATSYLSLKTNININTVENSPSFKPGSYDVVIYDISTNDTYLEPFVELCKMYVDSDIEFSFVDFFYSLLRLFEPNKETSFTNLVGMFGELYFIKLLFEKYNIATDKNWHNSFGSNDKYDFSFKDLNVEIKTTAKPDMRFSIKHSQIFNDKTNYIVVINLNADNSGSTVAELYHFFKTTKPFCNNIDFMINLEKEKQKVSPNDFRDKKFSFCKLNLYLNEQIDSIENIPCCIDSISYMYDFVGQKNLNLEFLIGEIKK